ncbi:MAG: PAS domain S-box protein, partial [Methanospirillum sp.]|uniref:PAS domain S-box protein n=1 Tax=Methanospirillum sp. TaxID=45200 RepID=UPI00236B2FE9
LSPAEIHQLSGVTSLNLSVLPASATDPALSLHGGEYISAINSTDPRITFSMVSPDTIQSSITISDITGTNPFLLVVTSDRSIYHQGISTIVSFVAILIIIGLLFIVTTLILMDQLVLKRLSILISRARTRNTSLNGVEDSLFTSGDELSELAHALTPVFDQVTRSEAELLEALKRTEESEHKYRELADSLPEFVFEVDCSGRLTFLNRVGFQISGYQSEDMERGLYAQDLIIPAEKERFIENMGRILNGERTIDHEYTAIRRDGSRFPIVIYSIQTRQNDIVTGLRGFAIDITERRKMEASKRKLADIVQHTRAGIMTGSKDEVDVINPAYAIMHGYTPEEIVTIPVFSLFSPDLQKDFPGHLRKAELFGHFVFEAEHLHRDGTSFPTLNDLTVIPDPERGDPYWILNVQDITEHRLAWKILMESESLRESHRQLRDVISRLPDATFVVDKDGWVILWNSAMEQLTRIKADDIIGRGQYEYAIPFYGYKRPVLLNFVLHPELPAEAQYSGLTRHDGTLSVEEFLADTVNGPMYLSVVANPLYDAKGRLIGAIQSIRDISSRKLVEEALMRTNEKLNLLSSITRHDIRNRITVFFGILPIIKKMSTDQEMDEMIDMLEKAALAIRDQIEFTGDYQDMGVHAPEWWDISKLLDHVKDQGLLSDGILENRLHGLMIYADPLLERVFYNLVDNAVRHGGQISRITASYIQKDQEVLIIFDDDGSGIPHELKDRIFERGYGKNTGLGLFLVREILSITGIAIRETGTYGTGARFEIVVPEGCYRTPESQDS